MAVVKCSDGIYGIPQDAEARMFFYNKKLLRAAGYDNAFIEAMPARTLSGELTMDDVIDIAKRVISKTKAQYGILHRPNENSDRILSFDASLARCHRHRQAGNQQNQGSIRHLAPAQQKF